MGFGFRLPFNWVERRGNGRSIRARAGEQGGEKAQSSNVTLFQGRRRGKRIKRRASRGNFEDGPELLAVGDPEPSKVAAQTPLQKRKKKKKGREKRGGE
jgi:hypothetical protein